MEISYTADMTKAYKAICESEYLNTEWNNNDGVDDKDNSSFITINISEEQKMAVYEYIIKRIRAFFREHADDENIENLIKSSSTIIAAMTLGWMKDNLNINELKEDTGDFYPEHVFIMHDNKGAYPDIPLSVRELVDSVFKRALGEFNEMK